MSTETSNWIPRKRLRFVVGLAIAFTAVGALGAAWSRSALVLLLPALGCAVAALVMVRVRWQLSPSGGGWERRIHQFVISRLSLGPEARVSALDIGCGDGSLLIELLAHAPGVAATGVDFWGANWDYARTACESRLAGLGLHAVFRRMDAATLELPDASFDIVVSVMCFHEVRAPAGSTTRGPVVAVREAMRVLRPGGHFVLVDRFGDAGDYGQPGELAAALSGTADLRREPLVATLGVPWPLKTRRALGPVEALSGSKR